MLTLRDASIYHDWLIDLDGVIFQVEQNDRPPDAILFLSLLLNSLLKIGKEPKDLWKSEVIFVIASYRSGFAMPEDELGKG